MQRRKKQLLGLAGLALIAAITAIAFAIPAPGASAESVEYGVGLTVKVEEQVPEGMPVANLITPTDGYQTVDQTLTIKFSYKNANSATTVVLEKYSSDGSVVDTVNIPVDSCNMNGSGECTLTYDMGDFPLSDDPLENTGVKYKLTVTPKAGSKEGTADKATIFRRAAFLKYENHVDASTNNPYISAYINKDMGVEYAVIQVYDKVTNQPVFMKDGKEAPLRISAEQIANAGGKIEMLLPLNEYNLKAGNYLAVLVAYGSEKDADGKNKALAIATEDVPYSPKGGGSPVDPDDPNKPDEPGPDDPNNPDTPDVPGTGSIFRDLNISKADYLIVGLIAFGMVTGFAIFLIVRRNKR